MARTSRALLHPAADLGRIVVFETFNPTRASSGDAISRIHADLKSVYSSKAKPMFSPRSSELQSAPL